MAYYYYYYYCYWYHHHRRRRRRNHHSGMNQFKLDVSSSDTYYTVTWFDSLAGIAVILMMSVD